ncbi:oncostatin-M [Apodemus sylvaticus]|uniref:oncostatin-M n=1 Tax=Apodemus sylvaticus TaxID=10129 RepID=UPI0022422525|nr:oncostatin-M [Apodemus sylvaticus]XP_052054835.1 oncostatin-M [Apodemus sylvaticus]XP_052054836.1 oncostatin-M [Apodemus sylvaticus]
MQTQLPPRTLLSLALSLLFLSTAWARRRCSSASPQLLSQLQSQANITRDTATLLEPYIHLQNLNTPTLRAACTEHPVAFPSEDTLRQLSKPRFLSTVYTTLDRVWHQVGALKQQFLKTQAFPELESTRQNIQGIRNNVYCMAQLLHRPLEIPEPTQAYSGTSQSTTITPGAFQTRIDSCRFLWGYHCFMGSVGRVFSEWEDGSRRSRRHSPLRAQRKGVRRIRPSRSSQGRMPRAQVPR